MAREVSRPVVGWKTAFLNEVAKVGMSSGHRLREGTHAQGVPCKGAYRVWVIDCDRTQGVVFREVHVGHGYCNRYRRNKNVKM